MFALGGLRRFAFTADSIPEATTKIILPNSNNAFFLHDAYSGYYEGLALSSDSYGNESRARISNISEIAMGNGDGLTIVDLTSPDYVASNITVMGGTNSSATSIFWGTEADDTFISNGSNNVIFGGSGNNTALLGNGVDILQYVANGGANDIITNFDPTIDRIQLWKASEDWLTGLSVEVDEAEDDAIATWEGNTIRLKGLGSLATSDDLSWITINNHWNQLIAESLDIFGVDTIQYSM
jgi:Ca2+-binding RTX toxin-like protein